MEIDLKTSAQDQNNDREPTNREILETIKKLDTSVDQRFTSSDERFNRLETQNREILETINEFATSIEGEIGAVKGEIGGVKSEVGTIKSEIGELKTKMVAMEATMVTKEYLDEKLGDLKGDLVILTRKEDRKVVRLVEILRDKNILAVEEVKQILAMEPFPQLLV